MEMYYVKCGKCGCEYNPAHSNGCAQCGFGRVVSTSSSTATPVFMPETPPQKGDIKC